MAEAGLKEDNVTNRTEWRKKLISYTGDPRWRDKPGMKKKKKKRKASIPIDEPNIWLSDLYYST